MCEQKRHKWADVIHAYAEGKPIQYRLVNGGKKHEWCDCTHFEHWSNVEWRIKPEKKTYWVNVYENSFSQRPPYTGAVYASELDAKAAIKLKRNYIKTISFEVEE